MIKLEDFILINDLGYKNFLCQVKSLGREENNLRAISVKVIYPNLGKDLFKILVDTDKVKILTDAEVRVIRCVYET